MIWTLHLMWPFVTRSCGIFKYLIVHYSRIRIKKYNFYSPTIEAHWPKRMCHLGDVCVKLDMWCRYLSVSGCICVYVCVCVHDYIRLTYTYKETKITFNWHILIDSVILKVKLKDKVTDHSPGVLRSIVT